MKLPLILALLSAVSAACSSYYWWKSARLSFKPSVVNVTVNSKPAVNAADIAGFVQQSGKLNAKAAAFAGISVVLSAASAVAASL